MIFTEFRFLIFFVIVFCVHWALPNPRARKLWLLVNSYVFYGAWDWRFLSLIALSTIIDYFSALAIEAAKSTRGRQLALAVSMVMNLSLLGVFKYYNFFVESAVAILAWVGLPASPSTMAIVLPAGISFYTFQTMSYTIDVYRRELPATRDFFEFSLFVSFFPQLVAGPIVRAVDFIPQLAKPQRFAAVDVRAAGGEEPAARVEPRAAEQARPAGFEFGPRLAVLGRPHDQLRPQHARDVPPVR